MDFYLELHFFGAVPVRKKYVFFYEGRDLLYFPGPLLALLYMRGHSLVELTEHDGSAADITLHSM